MKFNPNTHHLFTDKNQFIKTIVCPNDARWSGMNPSSESSRLCMHCDKNVIDIKGMSDDEVLEIVKNDSSACFKFDLNYQNIKVIKNHDFSELNLMELRVIKTAREEESINSAVDAGYTPLIKRLQKSKEICSKYAIIKNKKTGKIKQVRDFRFGRYIDSNQYEMVLDFEYYYPHNFPSPFAAYLIPPDLEVGEAVWLEDLIEDYVSSVWNQGDVNRLESCEAIWNGKDFEILFESAQISERIG